RFPEKARAFAVFVRELSHQQLNRALRVPGRRLELRSRIYVARRALILSDGTTTVTRGSGQDSTRDPGLRLGRRRRHCIHERELGKGRDVEQQRSHFGEDRASHVVVGVAKRFTRLYCVKLEIQPPASRGCAHDLLDRLEQSVPTAVEVEAAELRAHL